MFEWAIGRVYIGPLERDDNFKSKTLQNLNICISAKFAIISMNSEGVSAIFGEE
jgi:hypothetical protein